MKKRIVYLFAAMCFFGPLSSAALITTTPKKRTIAYDEFPKGPPKDFNIDALAMFNNIATLEDVILTKNEITKKLEELYNNNDMDEQEKAFWLLKLASYKEAVDTLQNDMISVPAFHGIGLSPTKAAGIGLMTGLFYALLAKGLLSLNGALSGMLAKCLLPLKGALSGMLFSPKPSHSETHTIENQKESNVRP